MVLYGDIYGVCLTWQQVADGAIWCISYQVAGS